MSSSLPARPDLDQFRRQAKELRDAARVGAQSAVERVARQGLETDRRAMTLAAAQLVIAREWGFASWPKLKAAVESRAALGRRVEAFVAASVEGRLRQAQRLLEQDADIARIDVRAAAVLGDAVGVGELVAAEPSRATAADRERGWPPLLYACYSHWFRAAPRRASGIVDVVGLLLDANASPDTNNGGRPHHGYRSALHGSVTVNHPAVTGVLLERGADPNDGESLYQAAAYRGHECLRLLIAHGAIVAGSWALDVAVGADDAEAVRLLLGAAARQNPAQARELASGVLARAAARASTAVVEALLAGGADSSERDRDGLSPLRHAVRVGNEQLAAVLRWHGALDDATEIDHFLGACTRGDRRHAERLLREQPALFDRLSVHDRAAIVDAAASGRAEAVRLMLELGFSPHQRNDSGETPLHSAAFAGNAETVRILIDHGSELDARDANYRATALGYAIVGSGEHQDTDGDWVTTVRLLLDAGADRAGARASSPASEDVVEVLRGYGIMGEDEAVQR